MNLKFTPIWKGFKDNTKLKFRDFSKDILVIKSCFLGLGVMAVSLWLLFDQQLYLQNMGAEQADYFIGTYIILAVGMIMTLVGKYNTQHIFRSFTYKNFLVKSGNCFWKFPLGNFFLVYKTCNPSFYQSNLSLLSAQIQTKPIYLNYFQNIFYQDFWAAAGRGKNRLGCWER